MYKRQVKDIVERCGVNRNTFYYHFRDIPDAVEAMVKEELNDILKDQKVPESVSDCMEILVNAVQKNKKAMIHLYRSIQRDVFADYLDHAAERVVEELINRAVGDFEMDQEDRHLISRYYKCVFVGAVSYTHLVAKRQEISDKYLEQIISILNKAGFVRSVRGPQGGYALQQTPDKYTVGMILRLTEGSRCV